MKASVVRVGKTYQGEFNDGAEGNGLDIVSGAVVGDKVVFTLSRGELGGVMLAKMEGDEKMDVTISVQIDDYYVPLIGMKLKKDVNNKARIAENDKHLYK